MEIDGWQKVILWGVFIFFLGAVLLRQEAGINQDLGRHLRLGEMMVSGGPPNGVASEARKCALFTNCLTYTYPDYPFVNHHWGSEMLFFVAYKFGGFPFLIIFKAIILALTFVIIVRHSSQQVKSEKLKVKSLAIAMMATFFSIQMMADRLTTRPEIFGYLLFSLLFWILNRKNLGIWGILGIWGTMLLWVNLHISFVFGLILVWIWAGTKMLGSRSSVARFAGASARRVGYQSIVNQLPVSQSETDKLKTEKLETDLSAEKRAMSPVRRDEWQAEAGNRKPKTDNGLTLAVPTISTIITLLNPAGFRGAVMPFSIMKDYGYTIVENMTPFFLRAFKPQPEYWIYALILLATIILGVIRGFREIGGFGGMTILIFSVFPLIAVRHLAFFALTAAPVLTPLLAVKFRKLNSDWKFAKLPILVSVGLFLAAFTNPIPLAYAKLPAVGLAEDKRHEQAVKFVKEHDLPRQGRGKPGKMWNNYDIGSYLEWALPEYPTFVDGRPEAFPAGFFQETYIPMQESRQKWDEAVERYDIQWVFAALTDATPWFGKWRAMIGRHEGWKVVYIDNATAILVRQN